MPAKVNKAAQVTRRARGGNVFEDLGFTAEEAAILEMKTQLHIEIMRAIEQQKFDAAAVGESAGRSPTAGERVDQWQDLADDRGFAGEVSLPPGPRSHDEGEAEPRGRGGDRVGLRRKV